MSLITLGVPASLSPGVKTAWTFVQNTGQNVCLEFPPWTRNTGEKQTSAVYATQTRAVTAAWPSPSAPMPGKLREQGIAGVGIRSGQVKASDSTTQKALCQGEGNDSNGMEGFGCPEGWQPEPLS